MSSIIGLNLSDLANQPFIKDSLGSISPEQLNTIMAQHAKNTAEDNGLENVDDCDGLISEETGVGRYGISVEELENSGYIKPGTNERFIGEGITATETLNNPSVWTGKDGIVDVNGILNNSNVQAQIRSTAMGQTLAELQVAKVITGNEAPATVASILNTANKYGVNTVKDWLGIGSGAGTIGMYVGMGVDKFFEKKNVYDTVLGTEMDLVSRGAQYSVDYFDEKVAPTFGINSGTIDTVTDTVKDVASDVSDAIGQFTTDLKGAITEFNIGVNNTIVSVSDYAAESIINTANTVGGIVGIESFGGDVVADLSGSIQTTLGGLVSAGIGWAIGALFGGGGGPRTISPPAVTQTVNRAGIDAAVVRLIGNPKVPAPNYTGIVNASVFQPPTLSGVTYADQFSSWFGKTVTVCSCSDPTLIAPNQAECEDAGGTWTCTEVNNSTVGVA